MSEEASNAALMKLDPTLVGPRVNFRWLETLWLQVTGTWCNIACRHCFITCGPKAHDVPVMSVHQIEDALEQGRALGMKQVYYTGGEPFLHPEIRRIVNSALAVASLTVITNGLLLDDEMVRWIIATFERSRYSFDLRVSLDGMTSDQNDPVRGRGTFKKIVAAIQRLSRAGLSPVVTVVEHEEGLAAEQGRTKFLGFLRGLGIRQPRVKFLPLLRIGREERRTHGYARPRALTAEPLQSEVESTLLCASGRIATAQGIYTCPILVKHPTAQLGDKLVEGAHGIQLQWSACQTCVLEGLRCNT